MEPASPNLNLFLCQGKQTTEVIYAIMATASGAVNDARTDLEILKNPLGAYSSAGSASITRRPISRRMYLPGQRINAAAS